MRDRRDYLRSALTDPAAVAAALRLRCSHDGAVMVCCPVHPDRSPSCSISVGERGTIRAYCFGCGFAGDVFALIAAVHGLDCRTDFAAVLDHAEEIAEHADCSAPPVPTRRTEPVDPDDAARYHGAATALLLQLRLDGAGAEYLAGRGLLAEAEHDGWRFRPRSFAVNANTYHPGAEIVIPWRDPDGSISVLQGRRLDGAEPKYLFPRRRKPAWPHGSERWSDDDRAVVLCEGAADVLARRVLDRQKGLDRIVLGLPGVASWSESWGRLIGNRSVVVAFDADDPGDRAAIDLSPRLYRAGATRVTRLRPVGAKDWAAQIEGGHHV